MEVTVLGILTDSRFLQSENRPPSMVSKEFGRMTDLRSGQPAYLQPIITQYFIDNKSEIWLLFLIAHSKR